MTNKDKTELIKSVTSKVRGGRKDHNDLPINSRNVVSGSNGWGQGQHVSDDYIANNPVMAIKLYPDLRGFVNCSNEAYALIQQTSILDLKKLIDESKVPTSRPKGSPDKKEGK